jgi:U3 small nucleolar RNA-associated protein 4
MESGDRSDPRKAFLPILPRILFVDSLQRSVSSQAGSIWSMAANPSSTLLALGCEDGSVRILSLADDTLMHHRRFDRVKSRLLSIAWGPPVPRQSSRPVARSGGDDSSSEEDETDGWVDSWLVAGCSDSSLRKFDVASGRVLDRMATDKSRGERTLVWAIGVLGYVLSPSSE